MKKIAALLSLIFFLFLTKSSVNATGYCNFSPEGANGQPYGDVTISSNCVIYESVNGTSLGNLTLQNSVITLNSTLVFSPGKQISIGPNSIIYINTNGKITQNGLCIKDADNDGYADVITLDKDPESGLPLTNPITQIGKVEAGAGGNCPSGYRPSDTNVQNLTIVDADPLTASATIIATSDRELLRLGFMINGVTDVFAGTGDIQIVNKNLLVCNGASCPADNFLNLTPATGNIYVGGKVGIGTTNPTNALSIAGNIYSDAYISKIIQERAGTYTNYSEFTTSPVGQGASWSINSTYDPGAGNGVANSTFKVNAGTYNTGAGMLRFDGNSKYWGAWMSGASGGQGTAVTFTQLANLSTNGSWLSSRGTNSDFYLTSAGKVGIGTTTPTEKLAVSNGAIMINSASTVDNDGRGITLNSDDDFLYDGEYIPQYSFGFHSFGGGSNAYVSGWQGVDIFTGGGHRLRINSSGNVGIGTTAPSSTLQVNGTSQTAANFATTGSRAGQIQIDGGTAGVGSGGGILFSAFEDPFAGIRGYITDAGNYGTGDLVFGTRNISTDTFLTERIRISSNGNVGIGTTTPGSKLDVNGAIYNNSTLSTTGHMWITNASPTIYFKDTDHRGAMLHNNSNLFYVLRGCEATNSTTWCQTGGAWPFYINLENNGAVFGGTVTATSDIRLKTNIQPLPENTLDKVQQLRGVYFNWKTEADMGNARQIGVIAQEVEKIFPELVITGADGYKAVGYDRLGPILIEAIKEQQVEIDSLKSQVTDLKNEVDQIKQLLKMPR